MNDVENRQEIGRRVQEELFGEYPASVRGPIIDKYAPEWAAFADETIFGWGWNRDVLSRRDRSLITVSMLAALEAMPQLKQHLKGALNIGFSKEELIDVVMNLVFYAGWPRAQNCLGVLIEVLEERER